jgi:hypothetical protein
LLPFPGEIWETILNFPPSGAVLGPPGELTRYLSQGVQPAPTFVGLTADWVAAIGQVAGAVGTVVAVVVALLAGRRAQKLRDEDRRERDTAQTELISFEVTVAEDRSHAQVTITNDSLEPIRKASVDEVVAKGDKDRVQPRYAFLPGNGTEEPRRLVRAQGSVSFLFYFLDRPNGQKTTWPEESVVSIGWQDPRGTHWNLDSTGRIAHVISRADEIPPMPPWWKQQWWDPYRDRPYASWRTRQKWKWERRVLLLRYWFGAWYDRFRGRELRPKQ